MNKILNIPGSYELKSLKLYSQTGIGIDLDHLFLEFSVFEDIFGNVISGALTIAESYNIVSNIPVMEGDVVRFHATINSQDEIMAEVDDIKQELLIDLEIIKITDRIAVKKDVSSVTFILSSTGWSDNSFQRVSRSFNQKLYSDMVQTIFDENYQIGGLAEFVRSSSFTSGGSSAAWSEPKGIEIEPTLGLYNLVIPNWNPLRTFNFLANRSTNQNDVSDWLFYEDIDSYKFVSIDSRLSMPPVGEHFTQMSNVKENNKPHPGIYKNFHQLQYTDSGDILKASRSGMLGHNMMVYNVYNKIMTEYRSLSLPEADNYVIEKDFSYIENFDKKNHCDDNRVPLTSQLTSEKFSMEPGQSKRTFIIDHPLMFDEQLNGYEYDKFIRQRASQREAIDYFKLTATGPGLFSRTIGNMITLNLSSPEISSSGKLDPRLRGNYLITALRRKFTPALHSMTVELTKDNYYSDNSNPIWQSGIEKITTRDPNLNIGGGL